MYLTFSTKTITDFSENNIETLYNSGFVFTRRGKGEMDKTRSVRIDLSKFKLSSENRRVLRKNNNLELKTVPLPHPNYDWNIHKLGFEFYTKKFGDKTFSANKIKELLTDNAKSNFNLLLTYSTCHPEQPSSDRVYPREAGEGSLKADKAPIGYTICMQTKNIIHYSYPFYNLSSDNTNLGIGMMTEAIVWAKENNKQHVYLGSAKDSASLYKFQFEGVEWFDGDKWENDVEKLKKILR